MPKDRVLSTKTFVISHFLILTLGLGFFGWIYYIVYGDELKGIAQDYNPVTQEPTSFILEITNPEDDTLTYDSNLLIAGKTAADATVIISNQSSDVGLTAEGDGQFSKVFPLSEGANIIEITAFDNEGNSKTVYRSIYYSKEKI